MSAPDPLCLFDPSTNAVVDLLRPREGEAAALLRLAPFDPQLIVLPLREALRRRRNALAPAAAAAPSRGRVVPFGRGVRRPGRIAPPEPALGASGRKERA
jgi:hypothetical protein